MVELNNNLIETYFKIYILERVAEKYKILESKPKSKHYDWSYYYEPNLTKYNWWDININKLTSWKLVKKEIDKFKMLAKNTRITIYIHKKVYGYSYIYNFIQRRRNTTFINHNKRFKRCILCLTSNIYVNTNQLLPYNYTSNSVNSYNITTPNTLDTIDLIENSLTHNSFTEKVDGIAKRNIRLRRCFPQFPKIQSVNTEYLESDNMHFIIGLSKGRESHCDNFIDTIKCLRQQHDYTKNTIFWSVISLQNIDSNAIKNMLINEKQNYTKYCNLQKNPAYKNNTFWWPKMIFKLSYDNFKEYLQLLNLIETKYYYMFHLFKNDGWILQNENYSSDDDLIEEHKKAFKLKPRNLLTIDLMFKDFQWLTYDNINFLHSFKEYDINCSDFIPNFM